MTAVTYGIVEERYILGNCSRTSYGIAAYANSEVDGSAIIVASVSDVSDKKHEMEELVRLCNSMDLSPIHLYDVVEDFLSM